MAIDWFGDSIEYPGLVELLQATCDSLFPDNYFYKLSEMAASGDQIALMEYEDALAQVIDASYLREPQLFGNILWIDTDLGTPMWIRPGEVWKPAHEFTEADDTTPKFKRSILANRRAMIATGSSIFEQAITNYTNKQLDAMRDTQ